MLSINKRCYEAESYKFCSQTIYEACKKALESGNLSDEERRIVKLYVDKGRSNGLDLSTNDKEKFDVVVAVCQNKQAQFDYNLRSALTTFEHKVTDPTKMREFPEDFLRSKAVDPTHWKEGPWIIDLAPPVVKTFLGMIEFILSFKNLAYFKSFFLNHVSQNIVQTRCRDSTFGSLM